MVKGKGKRVLRMRMTSGGKNNKRLMPIKSKRVKKSVTDPEQIPASKGDINRLIELSDWPPAVTRDPNGIRMKEAHNQLASLMNASYEDFNKGFTNALNRLTHFGSIYQKNLINKLSGSNNPSAPEQSTSSEKVPETLLSVKPKQAPPTQRKAKKIRIYRDSDTSDTYFTPDDDDDDWWDEQKKKKGVGKRSRFRVQRP